MWCERINTKRDVDDVKTILEVVIEEELGSVETDPIGHLILN